MSLVDYRCCVCGALVTDVDPASISREAGLCPQCGSNARLRTIAHLLSLNLLGKAVPLLDWPVRMDLTVLGISDWYRFNEFLAGKVSYTNTQFDVELFVGWEYLDITQPPEKYLGVADAVVCSEVLEHVAPPADRAIEGLYALLKPGGTLIVTVPYWFRETREHFPELHEWTIEHRESGRVLVNITRDGRRQEFDALRFHGGGDDVLEMRIWGLSDFVARLEAAGFTDVSIFEEELLEHGIANRGKYQAGFPIVARHP